MPHRILLQSGDQGNDHAAQLRRDHDAGSNVRLLYRDRLLRLDAGKHRRKDAQGAASRDGDRAARQACGRSELRGLPYAGRGGSDGSYDLPQPYAR